MDEDFVATQTFNISEEENQTLPHGVGPNTTAFQVVLLTMLKCTNNRHGLILCCIPRTASGYFYEVLLVRLMAAAATGLGRLPGRLAHQLKS